MEIFKIVKLIIFLVISLVIMIPMWYTFLDHRYATCSIEEFNAGKHHLINHITITGNAQFNYAYRYEELSNDTLYNVSYFIPLVDSLWTIDKPVKTILQFESGKMAFDSGFNEAVERLDKEIDSFSKLKSNRIAFTGNNKILEFPKLEDQTENYFKNISHLKISSSFNISKIIVREHFSMLGFTFMTVFTVVIGFFLYYFAKPIFKSRRKNYS
jgi:hypothetical protein